MGKILLWLVGIATAIVVTSSTVGGLLPKAELESDGSGFGECDSCAVDEPYIDADYGVRIADEPSLSDRATPVIRALPDGRQVVVDVFRPPATLTS